MNTITSQELKEAYIKLKSHVYYDTSELFIRRKLAIFETGLETKNYPFHSPLPKVSLDNQFDEIAQKINDYQHKGIEDLFGKINLLFLPKKFLKNSDGDNFLTNKRVYEEYKIDKVNVFADISVEFHLISILWIMKHGCKLDAKLDSSCLGNRLILNKSTDKVIKGRGLFKPYFNQYQKWRDESVSEARRKLKEGNNIAFINLDLKDYFYSVRLQFEDIEKDIFGEDGYKGDSIIHDIFKELHFNITKKLAAKNYPNKTIASINPNTTILPIGIYSSYILANYYLHDFDKRIKKLIPHVYYSRYVDDILIVIQNPDFDFYKNQGNIGFSFDKYYKEENSIENRITYAKTKEDYYIEVSKTEQFILETFYPLVKLVDFPNELKNTDDNKDEKIKTIFEINGLEGAYFQGEKTLLYYFDKSESLAVIDKLKQELEERSSEFRDFPDDSIGDGAFDEQAYHLLFDGTEGKIRTLKDYKENKYGLSVFLANRIFSALRHSKRVDEEETQKLLNLFKGLNNLEHFRLWEKVFTFFMVNNNKSGFISFYKHTLEQIKKLDNQKGTKIHKSEITYEDVTLSLVNYFDIAFEMTLALNPGFIRREDKEYKQLEIYHNIYNEGKIDFFDEQHLFITSTSVYLRRFRNSNLIRHHYISHPLINYTNAININFSSLNLTEPQLPNSPNITNNLEFDIEKQKLSPRNVKFWECCFAVSNYELLKNCNSYIKKVDERCHYTSIFNEQQILDKAYKLYIQINDIESSKVLMKDFLKEYQIKITHPTDDKEVNINELHIIANERFVENPSISIANMQVSIKNIEASVKGKPNLNHTRYSTFSKLLKESRKGGADMFILPECSIPYSFVSSLAKYSDKNQMAIIGGLEHWNIDDVCYNFIVTIIPIKINGINDALVIYRLKNHYAPDEELIIRGYGFKVPKPQPYRYDLINWRNLYFTSFYCFELADTFHRSLLRSKIDLLIASEWNKDIPYFSNIVEALSRDLHCYIAQVNTSQYGDSRLTQPSESARKNLLNLKGGKNDTVLIQDLNIKSLREFQLKYFERIKADNDNIFKPVPPDWNRKDVNIRIDNKHFFDEKED